jgi:hypothetical protein
MTLSDQTIQKLSIALTSEVIDYIFQDQSYTDFMLEIIPEAVSKTLGTNDVDLISELTYCIMDNIEIKERNLIMINW